MLAAAIEGFTGSRRNPQERTMTQQTGRHHLPVGVFVERALIAAAIIGIVLVLVIGFI